MIEKIIKLLKIKLNKSNLKVKVNFEACQEKEQFQWFKSGKTKIVKKLNLQQFF